jgi:hypothetical protein
MLSLVMELDYRHDSLQTYLGIKEGRLSPTEMI